MAATKDDPLPFVKTAFAAHWSDTANLGDEEVVRELSQSVGVTDYDPEAGRTTLHNVQAQAKEIGVVEAPACWIDDQLFIGREHLPWTRSILQKQQGRHFPLSPCESANRELKDWFFPKSCMCPSQSSD